MSLSNTLLKQTSDSFLRVLIRPAAAVILVVGVGANAWAQELTLFENAHVIVGDGTELHQASVLVQGESILAVGEDLPLDIQPQRIIDLAGKTLMPALIDAHAHVGYQARNGWGADYYGEENLINNLRQYAFYGFSVVFSAGSDPDDFALRFQQEQVRGEHAAMAQFMFAAGMAPPGEGPNNQFLQHTTQLEQDLGMTILRGLSGEVQARLAVREVAEKGFRFIKLWVDDRGGSQTKLSKELYRAVIAQAQELELKVFIHQQAAGDMSDLLEAGADGFLHGRLGDAFTSNIAEAVAQRGAFVVPNLGLGELRREAIGQDQFLASILSTEAQTRLSEENSQRRLQPAYSEAQELALRAALQRMREAGADLVLGTDAGAVPDHPFGYTGHRELEIFVRLGVTPMEALVAATGNAARHLGLVDKGMIRSGFSADILVLDANPLLDIRHTRRIDRVYLAGEEIDRAALLAELQNADI